MRWEEGGRDRRVLAEEVWFVVCWGRVGRSFGTWISMKLEMKEAAIVIVTVPDMETGRNSAHVRVWKCDAKIGVVGDICGDE